VSVKTKKHVDSLPESTCFLLVSGKKLWRLCETFQKRRLTKARREISGDENNIRSNTAWHLARKHLPENTLVIKYAGIDGQTTPAFSPLKVTRY